MTAGGSDIAEGAPHGSGFDVGSVQFDPINGRDEREAYRPRAAA